MSAIDDDDYALARTEAKLSIVRKASLNLLFAAIKTKFGIETRVTPTDHQAGADDAIGRHSHSGAISSLKPAHELGRHSPSEFGTSG